VPLAFLRQRLAPAGLLTIALLGGGCSAPEPSLRPSQTGAATQSAEVTASATPREIVNPRHSVWYEVVRSGDLRGNSERKLIFGSLRGRFNGSIPLASQEAGEVGDGTEPFRWMDPQADGVFDGHVIVWERQGGSASIEAVDLRDGTVRELIDIQESIQVATADALLSRVFFVTVDGQTNVPSGLWMANIDERSPPVELPYEFTGTPVSSTFLYRLNASADGELIAIQGGEEAISVLDVPSGQSTAFDAGGPMIGFADDSLIAYGAPTPSDQRPVLAFVEDAADGRVVAIEMNSAQIARGLSGDLIVTMRIDDDDVRNYEIGVTLTTSATGEVVYRHSEDSVGPLLARRDRTFLGAETPAEWILLVDSFQPFVVDPTEEFKDPPASTYPLLLNLTTGETIRVGPFLTD
jgi:hypothetical protein